MEERSPRIFISHASLEAIIGEKFVDALIELGIDRKDIFYSSSYHTGVPIGKNFHEEVRMALNNSEVVVFLLTPNFYKSEFCLNEMGAVWYAKKQIIPILLGGLNFDDMHGFIDRNYIAYKPKKDEPYKLLTYLGKYIVKPNIVKGMDDIFGDFINMAEEISKTTSKLMIDNNNEISDTEKMILKNKFTDGEILFLNYFIESQTIILNDYSFYNQETEKWEYSEEEEKIKIYANKYSFDYEKAKNILKISGYIKYNYDENDEYYSCELEVKLFRDLLSISSLGREYIGSIKARNEIAFDIDIEEKHSGPTKETKIESIISHEGFKEIEGLLFNYLIDTCTFTLGDRWKASEQITDIKLWEEQNNIESKLSNNYNFVLKIINFQKLTEVESTTSYGNPREYKIKDEYVQQLNNLNVKCKEMLKGVLLRNKVEEELPF